jgi:hypothetical protein
LKDDAQGLCCIFLFLLAIKALKKPPSMHKHREKLDENNGPEGI